MSLRHDLDVTRGWTADGTRLLAEALEALDDDGFAAPSLLPGWTRAHVVAHVARNAEALTRLATWARTGEETPMYASPEQRDADIERTSGQPAADLRHDVAATAADLDVAFGALDGGAWDARVRVRQGTEVAARVLPWLRAREVWLHAVDLDVGADLAGAPVLLLDELARDVAGGLSRRDGCPALSLRPTDRDEVWRLGGSDGSPDGSPVASPGEDPGDDRPAVAGPAAELVLWLAGRSDGSTLDAEQPLPPLPAWL